MSGMNSHLGRHIDISFLIVLPIHTSNVYVSKHLLASEQQTYTLS